MSFKPHIWDQLRNITADGLINALIKDSWTEDTKVGASRAYIKGSARVTVHYHPKKTFGAKLLQHLLADIGWSEEDMKRLKLIK